MLRATGHLVRLGAEGKRGVYAALSDLREDYIAALGTEPDRDPEAEFYRALRGAIQKFGALPETDH